MMVIISLLLIYFLFVTVPVAVKNLKSCQIGSLSRRDSLLQLAAPTLGVGVRVPSLTTYLEFSLQVLYTCSLQSGRVGVETRRAHTP
jgi:hypothetical protein